MHFRTALLMTLAGVLAAAPWTAHAAEPAANDAPLMSQTELLERLDAKDPELVVLDVRTPAEYAAGHVPGARNVSHELLASRLEELSALKDRPVVLYCRSGRRTLLAVDTLRKAGFTRLLHLQGDYLAWENAQRPVEKDAPATP